MESFENKEDTLDSRWFSRLKRNFFEDYEKLSGDGVTREQTKSSFLSGEIENPTLDYPQLETFPFDEYESSLLSLKDDVIEGEPNEFVRKIYRTKINEMIATVRMLRAASASDYRRFSRYSDFIHGRPNHENTTYVCDAIQHDMLSRKPNTEEQTEAINQILSLVDGYQFALGDVDRSVLPEVEKDSEKIGSAEEAAEVLQNALRGIEADNWQVLVDSENGISNFSVSQEHELVRVPATDKIQKRGLTATKLQGLVEHEINTHVARRVNGERSKLQLLGLGLDRYVAGEEGVATYREQQVTGAEEFAGVPYYFALSLAKGYDGQKRDFRGVFEVMKLYYTAKGAKDAETSAWNSCVRIFRGTTCKTPGTVFAKDLAYLSGNKAVWNLVSRDSDAVMTFNVGKFDPTREDHVALLSQIAIIDSDLEDLK